MSTSATGSVRLTFTVTSACTGRTAQRDLVALEAAVRNADDLEAPSSLPASPSGTGKNSLLAALAEAAAEGGVANSQPEDEEDAATADAAPSAAVTVTEPRRSSRNEASTPVEVGAAKPRGRRKRSAAAAPSTEASARKRRAVNGAIGGPAVADAAPEGADKVAGGVRVQQCTGCLEVKPLTDFYKVRLGSEPQKLTSCWPMLTSSSSLSPIAIASCKALTGMKIAEPRALSCR